MTEISNQLLVTVGGNVVSILIMLVGGVFVLAENWKRDVNRLFFFLTISTALYSIFFVVAALQTEYDAAYFWWFLNIFDVFIALSVVHFIFRVINLHEKWRWFIIATYVSGLAIFAAAWAYPHLFLPQVVPKLYFPYYLEAGPLYVVMLVHFLGTPLVAFVNLIRVYFESGGMEKKRYEYFILMLIVGYVIGCTNFLLVFNVPFDPIFGMFIGFYLLPIAYGIFSTELMDIRLVIRRAFYYAVGIGAIAAFLSFLILLNDFLVASVPWFTVWSIPLAVSVIAFIIGRMVWRQAKETDRLKYEFITVAAHKLRTPLTRVRWIIPQLIQQTTDQKLVDGLMQIDVANNRLIELTNSLLEAAHTEESALSYAHDQLDWKQLVSGAVERFKLQMLEKRLDVFVTIADDLPVTRGDARRFASGGGSFF